MDDVNRAGGILARHRPPAGTHGEIGDPVAVEVPRRRRNPKHGAFARPIIP
ncbi:MAG: hypothetical protein R3F11_18320 [Verrucomicrobiales bacterium]